MLRTTARLGLAAFLAMAAASFSRPSFAETFYVAPRGDDSWTGKLPEPAPGGKDGPFATLVGARDAIRRLRASIGLHEAVRVVVRGGTYRITEPFVLEPRDSGTEKAPILYVGESGAGPVISGGKAIEGWRKEGRLWVAEVPEAKSSAWSFGALWVNGARRTRARCTLASRPTASATRG